ncbi:MAG TPA: hypothetical protein VF101_17335 [Gaiellaceae bacterium]
MASAASRHTSGKTSAQASESSAGSNGRHSDAVRELLVHATRIQLATLTSLSKFFVGWAQAADRYAQAVSDELLSRAHGETASRELLGRLATVSSRHLREVTALPADAVSHFNSELSRQTKPQQKQRVRRQAA